jgi:carbon starvation protein
MVLLEGFLVTTLDTAIRLTRYLFEEIWRTLLGKFDVFAAPVAASEPADWGTGEQTPVGAGGIPDAPVREDQPPAPALPVATTGLLRAVLRLLRMYWFNSAIAVGLMLAFALTGGQKALWQIFATSNQLLASMVLAIASLWLLRRRRSLWFALVPGILMLITTVTNLIIMLKGFLADPGKNATLLAADVFILVITIYLVIVGVREAVRTFARLRTETPGAAE